MAMIAGYFIFDTIFCTIALEKDWLMIQSYFHHITAIICFTITTWLNDKYGSMSQLIIIMECSTFFVNMRVLMSMLKLQDTTLYIVNGLSMTLVFFIVRVLYIIWLIAFKIGPEPILGLFTGNFWDTYPNRENVIYGKIAITSFIAMAFLNFFWFNKILKGLMKALAKS